MVVQEQTLYGIAAVVALVAMAVATLLLGRFEGRTRRHMLAMQLSLLALTIGYAVMALGFFVLRTPEGDPVYLSRFAVYTLTYSVLLGYIGLVGGASRRYRLLPVVAVLGFTYGTLVVQLAPAPFDTVGTVTVLGSLVLAIWAFFGPLTRIAQSVSGNRRLLFAKLRNLATLILISYLLLALMTRQALGFFDAFVGIFIAAYVDLLAHLGLAGLVLYSRDAVQEVAEEHASPLALFTADDQRPVEGSVGESAADD